MHILLISHGIYPIDASTGVELYTSEAAEFLSTEHEITVLVFTSNRLPPQSDIPKQRMGKINIIRVPGSKNQDPAPAFTAIHFRSLLQLLEPDLIYILSPYRLPFRLMEEPAHLGIPWIVHLHDYYLMCPKIKLLRRNERLCSGPKRWRCTQCLKKVRRPVSFLTYAANFSNRMVYARAVIEKASTVLCVSHDVAKRYAKFGLAPEKVITVSPVWRQENQLRLRFKGQEESSLRIGFFGGASSEKGINILANALIRVQCPWQLVIYGVREDKQARVFNIFKGREDRITLKGPFAPEKLDTICSNIDVLIVPSIWPETYGRVVDEAIARGVIVVASQLGGMSERLIDGLNGFVFPAGDSVKLAEKISYIYDHPDDLHKSMQFDFMLEHKKNDYSEKLLKICASVVKNRDKSGFIFDHELDVLRICDITNKPRDKVEQRLIGELRNPGSTVNAAWLAAGPPNTVAEIDAFYRASDSYLYDLVVAHSTWERDLWRTAALSAMTKLGCKSVLDYGAGIGCDSLFFASAGLRVTHYDVNEYCRKFAENAANSNMLDLTTVTETDSLPDKLFDAVYCTEVLEHVPNPVRELQRMHRILKPGGYLLATASFGSIGERFLTHLPSLAVYADQLGSLAAKVGLSLHEVISIPCNKMYLFKK